MSFPRDQLPFARGSTATAGDTLIVNQLGAMSAIQALAGQTNPQTTTVVAAQFSGAGGPGQLPTAAYPNPLTFYDLVGYTGNTVDSGHVFGLSHRMILRAVQYIPQSGSAWLSLNGLALAASTTIQNPGWFGTVVTGVQGTSGNPSYLPDPAYFLGRSSPVAVKPYDWFWVVEAGPAVGQVASANSVAANIALQSSGSGYMMQAAAAKFVVGTSDSNYGQTATNSTYGFGCYTIPSGNAPALGTAPTSTAAAVSGTIFSAAYAPVPNGVQINGYTTSNPTGQLNAAATTGSWMPSGGNNNASGLVAVWVRPFYTGQAES
jgi:hypothetical protein